MRNSENKQREIKKNAQSANILTRKPSIIARNVKSKTSNN